MMWKTLSLPILQKMIKHALERMPVELGQPFTIKIRHLIYGSNPPSLQKPGAEMGFFRKTLWRTTVSNGAWISSTSQKTNKVFVNFTPAETLPAWDERDRDGMKQKKNDSKDTATEAKTRDGGSGHPGTEDYSQVLKSRREPWDVSPSQSPRETNPADTLISNHEKNIFFCHFKSLSLW